MRLCDFCNDLDITVVSLPGARFVRGLGWAKDVPFFAGRNACSICKDSQQNPILVLLPGVRY